MGLKNHTVVEYPELKGTHKDHQNSALGPALDNPRIMLCDQEHCPNSS